MTATFRRLRNRSVVAIPCDRLFGATARRGALLIGKDVAGRPGRERGRSSSFRRVRLGPGLTVLPESSIREERAP